MPIGIPWVAAASTDFAPCAVTAHETSFISGACVATDFILSTPTSGGFVQQLLGISCSPEGLCPRRGRAAWWIPEGWRPVRHLTSSSLLRLVCTLRLSGKRCTGHWEAAYIIQGPGGPAREIYDRGHRVRWQKRWQASRDPDAAQLYCLCSAREKPYPKGACPGHLQGTQAAPAGSPARTTSQLGPFGVLWQGSRQGAGRSLCLPCLLSHEAVSPLPSAITAFLCWLMNGVTAHGGKNVSL